MLTSGNQCPSAGHIDGSSSDFRAPPVNGAQDINLPTFELPSLLHDGLFSNIPLSLLRICPTVE